MSAETLAAQLSTPELRARYGTSAQLRRTLSTSDHRLVEEYATAYHRSLSENQLAFLHLSKSGGTGLCELAKLNGCTRPGAGSNTFVANCASRHFHDNAWWLPVGAGRRILDPNLRRFARDAFEVHDRHVDSGRKCDVRPRRCGWPCKGATAGGRRAAGDEPCAAPSGCRAAGSTFIAVETAAPEGARCDGRLDVLLLREPLSRFASFGKELWRWGLLPSMAFRTRPGATPGDQAEAARRQAERRLECANFSALLEIAAPVVDNQLVRTLVGAPVYRLPAGQITHEHYITARERLRRADVLLLTGANLSRDLRLRLGWKVGDPGETHRRARPAAERSTCALVGAQREAAVAMNKWDIALYDEAVRLYAADAAFFERAAPAIDAAAAAAAVTPARGGGGGPADAAAAAGRLQSCGWASEAAAPPEGGGGFSLCSVREPNVRNSRLRRCCWGDLCTSAREHPAPLLPQPVACVQPPAGRTSAQREVRMPATVGRFSHAMCALSCQRYARFGLEDGGLFCACMDQPEVAAATALHPYECALPCAASGAASGNGRFHLTPTALPCGGNEAVAVYDTAATLAAMAAPCASADAAWPAAAAAAAASNPKFAECAPPEQLPCSAASGGDEDHRRSVYVHWHAPPGRSNATAAPFLPVGCYSCCARGAALERHGRWTPPPGVGDGGGLDAAARRRLARPRQCSERCAHATHFAVGAPSLAGGACLCGELPPVGWERDAKGMGQLDRRRVRPVGRREPQGKG